MSSNNQLADDVRPREVVGWAMYDFANSGYTTVVITAIYNAWFVSGIAGKAAWATFAWTTALSISYAAILITAPFVGAWADAHAAKKRAGRKGKPGSRSDYWGGFHRSRTCVKLSP